MGNNVVERLLLNSDNVSDITNDLYSKADKLDKEIEGYEKLLSTLRLSQRSNEIPVQLVDELFIKYSKIGSDTKLATSCVLVSELLKHIRFSDRESYNLLRLTVNYERSNSTSNINDFLLSETATGIRITRTCSDVSVQNTDESIIVNNIELINMYSIKRKIKDLNEVKAIALDRINIVSEIENGFRIGKYIGNVEVELN